MVAFLKSALSLLLVSYTLCAVINPKLTEWHLIETDLERHQFPLRDYILQVKTFLPEVYDTNPPYSVLFRTDKPTTMMVLLHEGSYDNQVGRLVWNTIKYDKGYDISIEQCDSKYKAYYTFPYGKKEDRRQIWNWNFFDDYVELTCNGVMMYDRSFDDGEVHPFVQEVSPEKCRALGDANVDKLIFKHMKGFYVRGVPKVNFPLVTGETEPPVPPTSDPLPPTTPEPTTPEPTTPEPTTPEPTTPEPTTPEPTTPEPTTPEPTTPEATTEQATTTTPYLTDEPDENTFGLRYPTCECWTAECGYCTNMECAVAQPLSVSDLGISVQSAVGWKKVNTVVLFDDEGNNLGDFWWSYKGIGLTGCIACQAPPAVRTVPSGSVVDWNLSLKGGVVKLSINGEVLFEKKLVKECAEQFAKATQYSFTGMSCENTFLFAPSEMLAGERINETCGGACPAA